MKEPLEETDHRPKGKHLHAQRHNPQHTVYCFFGKEDCFKKAMRSGDNEARTSDWACKISSWDMPLKTCLLSASILRRSRSLNAPSSCFDDDDDDDGNDRALDAAAGFCCIC